MSEDVEELREKVANPALIGENVPVEVHMKSIQGGLDQLQSDRQKASYLVCYVSQPFLASQIHFHLRRIL